MKKLIFTLGVAAVAITFAAPSEAREVKQLVGYVETTTTYSDRDAEFHKMDVNHDGVANFKEFQNAAILSNEYEMFKMNDTNNDGVLSIEEFRDFSKFGPAREASGNGRTYYNFNNKPVSAN